MRLDGVVLDYSFGSENADTVILQVIGEHEIKRLDREYELMKTVIGGDFLFTAMLVDDWYSDLSPWKCEEAINGKEFKGNATKTLNKLLEFAKQYKGRKLHLSGYSMAGLFAIWAVCNTDVFEGVAAVSPSVWYPGFADFFETADVKVDKLYLSLGKKEEKTRNKYMSQVGDAIRQISEKAIDKGIETVLEWNDGNHFHEPEKRMAKGIGWLIGK
ncbi:MAG: esterase [Parasporobacterium sp.]|nr:esterase [Parasporobacterium sp.]